MARANVYCSAMVTPRAVAGLIVAASVAALAAAFLAQYIGGLEPCPLCVYQRYPYGLTIAFGALALATTGRGQWPALFVGLSGAAFAAGGAIAVYHAGVEQGWFEGLAACAAGAETPDTLEDLRAQLLAAAPPRCDEAPWSLFGISIAGYNALYSAALAALSLASVAVLVRKARA